MRSTASGSKRGLLIASFRQLDGLGAVLRQRLEVAVEGIAAVLEAHAHGERFHALLNVPASRSPAPSSSMAVRKLATPSLPVGVLRVAALEGELHREQRIVVRFDEPGLDAAGALDYLDFHSVCGPCRGGKGECGEDEQSQRARDANAALPLRLSARLLPVEIVMHTNNPNKRL